MLNSESQSRMENIRTSIIGVDAESAAWIGGGKRLRVTYLVEVEAGQDVIAVKHFLYLAENGDITFPDDPKEFRHLNTACRMLLGMVADQHKEAFNQWIMEIGKNEVYHYGSLIKNLQTFFRDDSHESN